MVFDFNQERNRELTNGYVTRPGEQVQAQTPPWAELSHNYVTDSNHPAVGEVNGPDR
jgi:hypothetical protein